MTPVLKSKAPVLGTVVIAGLLVFVLTCSSVGATALSGASTVTGASSATNVWSYGVVKSITVPPQQGSNDWVYQGSATAGYTVTIYENSTSSTTFELTVYRTMGLAFSIRFCDVSCAAPTQWANESFREYEMTATFANFTNQGMVFANGTTEEVRALALENTTSFLHANLTETTDVYLPTIGELGPHLGYLGANLVANSAVSFSPSLGLIPVNLSPDSTWNSTSAFTAMGTASWSYYYAMHRPVGNTIVGPVSGGGSLSATGNVSVQGAYPAGSTFQYGGTTYSAITLTVIGPFDVREGVIFVPTSVDLFGSAGQAQPWSSNQNGTASAQTASLDIRPGGGDRLDIAASSWRYSSAAANAASPTAIVTGSSGLSPAVAGGNAVASGTIQGVPETSQQADQAHGCIIAGAGCASGSTPRSLLGLIVLSGVIATVAVLVSLAVVTRRRRVPPPVYPNAVLYPPGAAYPSAPAGTPATPPPPPRPEEDPLDHLW